MKSMARTDRIVPWTKVSYEIGSIQNDWGLAVEFKNPLIEKTLVSRSTSVDLVLGRADLRTGKSKYLWNVHEPKTNLVIEPHGGDRLDTTCKSIRLMDDGFHRADSFEVHCG